VLRSVAGISNCASFASPNDDDLHILHVVTAHFIARLRVNAFDTILTAWVLSVEGREWLRAEEKHFLTRFNSRGDPDRYKSESVLRMKAQFKDLFKPWKNQNPDADDIGPSRAAPIEEVQILAESISDVPDDRPVRLTRVSQQRADFARALEQQWAVTINERF
jgi:hypothetical protein